MSDDRDHSGTEPTPDRGAGGRLSRRDLVRLGVGGLAAGLAGCPLSERDPPLGDPTPAEPPAETPAHVAAFQPKSPPLETPWSDAVDPANPRPEYPRPQLTRERWQSLNGVWEFQAADASDPPPTGRQLTERVLVPFPVESALSGRMEGERHMWYRRTFTVPDGWDERVVLHFGAVDFEATVVVNGTKVTEHRGGYDRFSADITDALADSGDQELVVGVSDPTDDGQQPLGKQRHDPGGIYYTSCTGIWQTVWLEPVPEAHVADLSLTPDVENERLRVGVTHTGDGDLTVRATATDGEETVGTVTGPADEELALPVPDPNLWSPDDPFLYDLEVELLRDGERVDAVGSYFGMRSVGVRAVDGTPRLTLNGDAVFHMATLDQGYWPDGVYTAPTDEALKSDLVAHKDLGFNAVRKHVKVEPNRWYYWADRLGLLVWQDMPASAVRGERPSQAAREQFERELRQVVTELGNHPSVAMWVAFNEGWGAFDVPRIVDLIREEDPTRPVDAQSGVGVCRDNDRICGPGTSGEVVDHHTYPGPGRPPSTEDRAAVLGEYGGIGLQIPGHLWNPDRSYAYATAADGADLTDVYVEKIEQIRRYMESCGGLAAAVYTQLTDVEREINGLLTYDRRVLKPDGDRIRAAHEDLFGSAAQIDEGTERTATDTAPEQIGYWPLDRGSGSVAVDRSGDNDAQLRDLLGNPPQWTDGRVGSAVAFDGDHDVLDTGVSVVNTSEPFSVAAWVRLSRRGTDRVAVSQDGGSGSAFALGYRDDDDRFAFEALGTRVTGTTPVETGRWYHLVGAIEGCNGRIRLYVDGQRVASAPAKRTASPPAGRTVIGRGRANGTVTNYWAGAIDEVRLYRGALTDAGVERRFDDA